MNSTPPLSTEPIEFQFPATTVSHLSDGTAVHVIQNTNKDLVTVQLYMNVGSAHDVVRGAHAFAAQLMVNGAGDMSSEEFNLAVESLGCSINSSCDRTVTTVTGMGMADNFDPMVALMGDVVLRPRFDQSEIDTLRGRWINEMQIDHRDVDWLANQACNRVTYGEHPGRHPVRGSITQMRSLTRADIIDAHQRAIRSPRTIIVAGPLSPSEIVQHLESTLAGLPEASFNSILPRAHVVERTACIAPCPDTMQTAFRITMPGLPYDHPDYPALELTSHVLGGYSLARLFGILREEKGYTYGAYAATAVRQYSCTNDILTDVGNDHTADTVATIVEVLQQFSSELIDIDELENARQNLIGIFAQYMETPQQAASFLWKIIRDGLPSDYFSKLVHRIQMYQPEDLLSVQQRWYNVKRWAIGASGDPDIIVPAIRDHVDRYEIWDPITESA